MVDLSYEEVARWVADPIEDPIAFENWVGNKLYGLDVPKNDAWDRAVEIAKTIKSKDVGEVRDLGDVRDVEIILNGWQPEGILQIGTMGTVVCPVGRPGPADKTGAEVNGQKVGFDEIFILKLPQSETVKLKVKLHGGLKIEKKGNFTVDVPGGEVGIIIDTRGRPLELPTVDNRGRERLKKWQKAWEK